MTIKPDISFNELVQLAKQLDHSQWTKLKREVEMQQPLKNVDSDMVSLLMSAPTFSKSQLTNVAKARKAISQWRKK